MPPWSTKDKTKLTDKSLKYTVNRLKHEVRLLKARVWQLENFRDEMEQNKNG